MKILERASNQIAGHISGYRVQFSKGRRFSSHTQSLKHNLLFFCPRSEERVGVFGESNIALINEVKPDRVTVTDVAHFPHHSSLAITDLIFSGAKAQEIIPHFALIAHTKEKTNNILATYGKLGIENLFLIRGNPTTIGKDKSYMHHPTGYKDFAELIQAAKERMPNVNILVTAYPELHPFTREEYGTGDKAVRVEMDNLKRKIDMGASELVLQHTFNLDNIARFTELCAKENINLPMIPSIMPLCNPKYVRAFTEGVVDMSDEVRNFCERFEDNTLSDSAQGNLRDEAIEYSVKQIKSLPEFGIESFNLYVSNDHKTAKEVCEAAGLVAPSLPNTQKGNSFSR